MYGETSYLFLFFKILQNVEQKFKIMNMFFSSLFIYKNQDHLISSSLFLQKASV